ncbi:hypothetical protein BDZ89DRAFT_1164236 [Hymenopellis radicata]|nr:hypothetical protein BDZ89DRAFT_1164236 [Hymenopellis radicata]
MSIPLENVNICRTFTDPIDVPIMHSRNLMIDSFEFLWGLNRGEMISYFNLDGNFLRVQPELNEALTTRKVALLPPNHVVKELLAFQERNEKLPIAQRRIFTEIMAFEPCECRIIPLKPGVSLFARDACTGRVSPLKVPRAAFPTVTCDAHPFFVLTYACDGLVNPPKNVPRKLALEDNIRRCFSPWYMDPPLDFFEVCYDGQFGRPVPYQFRHLFPKSAPVPELAYSSSSSTDSGRSAKRSRLSTPQESESGKSVDIAKWLSDCARADLACDANGYPLDVVVPSKPQMVQAQNPKRKRV